MKPIKMVKFASALCLPLVFACTPEDGDENSEPRSGLLVQSQIQWTPDVAGFEYTVTRVSCDGEPVPVPPEVYRARIGPESLKLPSGIPAFENEPLDAESAHMFGDHFFVLPEGCYDVEAQPLDELGNASEQCYAAHQEGVEVVDGLTTEIMMISQCLGPARGGLDAIVALNNPPVIENLEFDPSKFVSSCDGVEVCVTASDPENDPLEFEWEVLSGPAMHYGPEVISTTHNSATGITEQCVLIQTGQVQSYDIKVTAYDLAWDSGSLIRIEDLLAEQGDPHESRDDLQFPIHAGIDCPVQGRSLVIMLTMNNQPGLTIANARRLAKNAVDWAHNKPTQPKILVVRDDAHHGESAGDPLFVRNQLVAAGFTDVTYRNEPAWGLFLSDIQDYDVVWFSNPGYPMDDPLTQSSLLAYRAMGGALILQGDDMGHFETSPVVMEPLTYLRYLNNGTMSCGALTDNNAGSNYEVTLGSAPHPVLSGLAGLSFPYGNDIDHTVPLGLGEQVLATAEFTRNNCSVTTNVIVALDPSLVSPWP